jgi:ABC-type phosphate transport system substrate-binding protein
MHCLILALALLPPYAADAADAADAGELVVVVNAASGVGKLNRSQVTDIFLGRFRVFPSGLAAEPIDQPDSEPLKTQFYRLLVDKDVAEINAYWARLIFSGRTAPPQKTGNGAEVLRLLTSRKGGIAYVERAWVDQRMTIVFDPYHDR